jgi:hypothetical protein
MARKAQLYDSDGVVKNRHQLYKVSFIGIEPMAGRVDVENRGEKYGAMYQV